MSSPLKVGLIGAGSISAAHMPAFQRYPDEVKMTAVCDIREDAARQYAKNVGADRVYTDVEKMLLDADIDAVDICTVHDQHADNVLAAAAAGKHILLEKPMGINMQECRDMLAATEKAGVTFMVAQCLRFEPHSRKIHQMIKEGEFGDIWSVRSDNFYQMVPPRSQVADYPPSPMANRWYSDGKRAGGGALISQTTHHLDLFRYYIGDVKRVTARSWTNHPLFTNGAEESIAATLEFENGAIGHVLSSWATRTPWHHCYWVLGELGSAVNRYMPGSSGPEQYMGPVDVSLSKYDRNEDNDSRFRRPEFVPLDTGGTELPTNQAIAVETQNGPRETLHFQPFINEILHFADCCRQRKEPISSGKDNLGTMKLVLGIYESARTGKPLDLAAF